jgi:hypothetical protein
MTAGIGFYSALKIDCDPECLRLLFSLEAGIRWQGMFNLRLEACNSNCIVQLESYEYHARCISSISASGVQGFIRRTGPV